jgi:branched-chain amino acid transport system substrate-binding protein
MGEIHFEPNGQLKSHYYLFTVKDRKIVVQP